MDCTNPWVLRKDTMLRKGQSSLEYIVLILLIIVGLISIQIYCHRYYMNHHEGHYVHQHVWN